MKIFSKYPWLKYFIATSIFLVISIMLFKGMRGDFLLPQSIDIGPLSIRIYALIILASASLAVLLVWKLVDEKVRKLVALEDVLLATFIPAFIGARLYHVLTDFYLYQNHPEQIFMIWNGGLGIIGGVIGGAIGLMLYLKYKKVDVSSVLPAVLVALPLAQALGRIGNLFNYELYGLPYDGGLAMFVPEAFRTAPFSDISYYHPLFLYEMAGTLALSFLLFVMFRKKNNFTSMLVVYVCGYGAIRYLLDFLRIEGNSGIMYLSYAQWFILALLFAVVIFGLIYQAWHMIKYKRLFTTHGKD